MLFEKFTNPFWVFFFVFFAMLTQKAKWQDQELQKNISDVLNESLRPNVFYVHFKFLKCVLLIERCLEQKYD